MIEIDSISSFEAIVRLRAHDDSRIVASIAKAHPKLERGLVWCTVCGKRLSVNAEFVMKLGWPKCCGKTMTLDSPEERKALEEKQ